MEAKRGWNKKWLILAVLYICGCSWLNDFQKDGELQLAGLKAPVKVVRDEKGMAYIYARNLEDALMAQGFVAAQDRLFSMELTRLFASGRICELAGEKAVALDTRMRTIGFYRHAQNKARLLDPESRRFFQKYIDGVNTFIKTRPESHHLEFKLAGIKPTPWSIVDSLAIVYYMSWASSANLDSEIMVADLADPDKVLAVLPGGVSGRILDKHGKDQIESFINGNKVYWWFSDAAIKAHSRNTLVLNP